MSKPFTSQKDKKRRQALNHRVEVVEHIPAMKLLAPPKSLVHTPSPIRKPIKKLPRINTPMETNHFIFSQLAILFVALSFLGGMYWVLNNETLQTKIADTMLPVIIKQAGSGLVVTTPEDELLVFTNALNISGVTVPKSSVVIAIAGSVNHFAATEADNTGKFESKVILAPGLNRIEVSTFNAAEDTKTIKRTVYYSEEKLQ